MNFPMSQCLPVEKIEGLEDFPYSFNNEDVPTYQLFKKLNYTNGTSKMESTSVFFYMAGGRFWCARIKFDIVPVGYTNLNVKLAANIDEALDNFNKYNRELRR